MHVLGKCFSETISRSAHFYIGWCLESILKLFSCCWFVLFLAFDLCRFCVVIRFFHPRHNGQWPPTSKDFYTRSYPLHYFLILILEKEPEFSIFNVECQTRNTGTIVITSLVWCCPWLGIEPETSCTRNQHSTNTIQYKIHLLPLVTFW